MCSIQKNVHTSTSAYAIHLAKKVQVSIRPENYLLAPAGIGQKSQQYIKGILTDFK